MRLDEARRSGHGNTVRTAKLRCYRVRFNIDGGREGSSNFRLFELLLGMAMMIVTAMIVMGVGENMMSSAG